MFATGNGLTLRAVVCVILHIANVEANASGTGFHMCRLSDASTTGPAEVSVEKKVFSLSSKPSADTCGLSCMSPEFYTRFLCSLFFRVAAVAAQIWPLRGIVFDPAAYAF